MAEIKLELPSELGEGLFTEASGEGFRKLVETVAQALINAQAAEHFAAGWNAKGVDRPNGYRNGYKSRGLQTVAGPIDLSVPQARNGSFRPTLFDKWQRSEKALLAACGEMVLAGVSNRNASRLAQEAFGANISPGLVSNLVKELEPGIQAFRARKLGKFPYLIIDARFDKVRSGHSVSSRAFLWVSGVNEAGQREVLGWLDWRGETKVAWETLFKQLKERGLEGVKLVVSDAHEGLVQAVMQAFPGSEWQECQAHFLRRSVEHVKTADQAAFHGDLRNVLHASSREQAMEQMELLRNRWTKKSEKAVEYVEDHLDSLLAILNYPANHHKRLRTTNMVERVNQELKRKGRLVRTWPNAASRERAYGLKLMEIHESWMGVTWLKMEGV